MSSPRLGERRGPFGPALLFGVLAVLTTWAALTAWRGFVDLPGTYLRPLGVLAGLLAVSGALLRWLGTPRWLTTLVQTVLTALVVTRQITGSFLPTGDTVAAIGHALEASVDSARQYAAPIGAEVPPVWPLLVVAGAGVLLLVDTLACTLRKVPAAGLGLLAVYALPSGVLDGGPDVGSFLAAAAGFLVLLHLESRDHLLRWGRAVGPDEDTLWRGNPMLEAMRAGAGRIGIGATALALVIPAFLPTVGVNVLDLGSGGGNGDIRIRKPIADMRRDLERGRDVPLIRVRTDDPDPSYLRVSVLNRFTGDEWSSGDRDVARDDRADGPVARPPGLASDVPTTAFDYDVEITEDFNSTWLPTQYPVSAVDAPGDWRFDPSTMDFLAADDDLDTRDLAYTMTALRVEFGTRRDFFRDSADDDVSEEVLDLPGTVPGVVRNLARDVTEGAVSDYERALLLQRWFRQDGGFTYDLAKAPEGTGNQTLESFLARDGRVGYCEQFASAMAVMARTLRIPARVAVGFLEPDRIGGDVWEYSSHDLHAWPELYFAGSGWVRFEPTPSGRVEQVPAYTRVPVDGGPDDPRGGPTAPSSATPGATATVAPSAGPSRRPEIERDAGDTANADDGGIPTPLLVGGLVALALVLLGGAAVGGPASVRTRARRHRLAGSPDDVWSEVRATAIDLGRHWPDGRSPREAGRLLLDHLGGPTDPTAERPRTGAEAAPEAADALERVVLEVERSRYARPGAVRTQERTTLAEDGALVVAALEAGVGPRARRRARWIPRSVWGR
ncbi:transglutaminaseTgpA domain-containing protein [Nocardioides sp. L-11A]|uniref:transglutaminaseTgpA domain-containing protein n=1 Tax=Nocardioides sp. L-11A TaxID=3043848 RepID=UPI00249CEA2C|nr:transglutaminaseTgpA domain-containing protein [Nocardioides sp. L-11A]